MSRSSRRRIRAEKAKTAKAARLTSAKKPFTCTAPVTITAADGDGKKLPTFSGVAYTGAPMVPGGWFGQIVVDLDGVEVPSQTQPILRQHDHNQIVGHSTAITVDADGIKVDGVLSGEPEHVAKVAVPAKNGFPWQMSIGADPITVEFLKAGETAVVNGREVTGPMDISRRTRLGEISFVPLGADGDTSATVSASKGSFSMNAKALLKFARAEGSLTAAKYSDDDIEKMSDAEAKAALKECMAAADDEDSSVVDDKTDAKASAATKAAIAASRAEVVREAKAATEEAIKASREAAAKEADRVAAIKTIVAKHGVSEVDLVVGGATQKVNLERTAIVEGWSTEKTELYALRASRPTGGTHFHFPSAPIMSEAVLECAVFDALPQFKLFDKEFYTKGEAGQRRVSEREERKITAELNARYPDQVRQAAHTHFKGRIGLQQLLTTLAAANGYRGPQTFNDPNGWGAVSEYLVGRGIRADGPSSINTPATLSNVQNKFMLQGYMFTEQAFMDVGSVLPVKDLKPTKSVQLFGDFQFAGLKPSGEIEHATIGDNPYANQADLQARMITIPLTYLINDDLGMFGQVPMMLGRGWGLRVNDLFWTKFLNPGFDDGGSTNFFAATHTIAGQSGNSNYSSGAGSALSSAGLQAAKLLFDRQVDPAGKKLGVDAEVLLYPPELDVTALELMNAQFILMAGLASTSAASKQPNTNIWKGRFKPVMSRYLSDSAYTGSSTTAWYLLANPGIIPVIQIAALNGQMTPTVQQASQDWQFNMLGITMRGWGGVGVSMQNFRGAVKSAGS